MHGPMNVKKKTGGLSVGIVAYFAFQFRRISAKFMRSILQLRTVLLHIRIALDIPALRNAKKQVHVSDNCSSTQFDRSAGTIASFKHLVPKT